MAFSGSILLVYVPLPMLPTEPSTNEFLPVKPFSQYLYFVNIRFDNPDWGIVLSVILVVLSLTLRVSIESSTCA